MTLERRVPDGRTHVAEIGMPTPAVVEYFDVLENRRLRLGARLEVVAMHEFLLERSDEQESA